MKVLIVDDDKSIRSILQAMIQDWGYEVLMAADGESAWQILNSLNHQPVIVLLDWILPGLDGLELCKRLRSAQQAACVYVIMLTGEKNGEEDIVNGFAAGADDFLVKPVSSRELSCRLAVGKRILSYQHQLEQRNQALEETTNVMEVVVRQLNQVNTRLKEIAMIDELTGIANRRSLEEYLSREWCHALRQQEYLAVIMLDVDFFKLYNDTYGHQAGDECLRAVAAVLAQNSKRSTDVAARYGGEEFAVVLRGTDSEGAWHVAENIRQNVEDLYMKTEASQIAPYVTVSLGVAAVIPKIANNYIEIIKHADEALYQAKEEGRNRTKVFTGKWSCY